MESTYNIGTYDSQDFIDYSLDFPLSSNSLTHILENIKS